jgi:hypothetical protein
MVTAMAARASEEVASTSPQLTPLLVEMTLNGRSIPDFHDVYESSSGQLWLPIEAIVRAGEGQAGSARAGRYALSLGAERPSVEIDINTNRLSVGNAQKPWPAEAIFQRDGRLYVQSQRVEQWFGIAASLGENGLSVRLQSERPLPVDLRVLREQRWRDFDRPGVATESRYHRFDAPYSAWGAPRGTLQMSTTADESASSLPLRASGSFNVEAGYVSNQIFYSGNDRGGLQTLRWRAGRESPSGRAFGIHGLYRLHFGDVSGLRMPLAGGGAQGRGLRFSTAPRSRPELFDVIRIEGDALPGWDAELYRGSALIDFQTIDADGRYEFEDVPLGYGANRLRVVLYGPSGEVEERQVERTIPASQLRAGERHFRGSVTQTGRSTIDLNDGNSVTGDHVRLRGDFGITNGLTASALMSLDKDPRSRFSPRYDDAPVTLDGEPTGDVERATGGFALQPDLGVVRMELVSLHQRDGASAQQLDLRFPLLAGFGVSAGYRHYTDGFLTTGRESRSRLIDDRLRLRLGGNLVGIGDLDFGSLRLEHTLSRFDSGGDLKEYELDWRHSIAALRLSHTLSQTRASDRRRTRYRLLAAYRHGKLSARTRLTANGGSVGDLSNTNVSGSLDYAFMEAPRLAAKISHGTGDRDASAGLNFGHELGPARLTASGGVDQSGDWSVGLRMTIGLGMEPATGPVLMPPSAADTGAIAVSARAGDRPMKGVGFRVNGRPHPVRTDDTGRAVITGLPAHRKARITLDRDTMVDPFLTTASPRLELVPRRGYTHQITMPFADAASVTGYARRADGSAIQGVEVIAERVDGQDQTATRSLSDGYFSFDVLSPGRWRLRIGADALPDDWQNPPVNLALDAGQQRFDVAVTATPPES